MREWHFYCGMGAKIGFFPCAEIRDFGEPGFGIFTRQGPAGRRALLGKIGAPPGSRLERWVFCGQRGGVPNGIRSGSGSGTFTVQTVLRRPLYIDREG